MTEQTSIGGLALATDPRSAAPSVDMVDEAVDNKRKLAIVGAVVAVVVILIAAFFLMKGKSAPAQPTAPDALGQAQSASTPAGAAAPVTAAKPVTLPKRFHGALGRDPFKAQYKAPVDTSAAGTASSGAPTTTTTTPVGTAIPVTTPTGSTSGSSTPTTTTGATTTGTSTGPGPAWVPVWIDLARVSGTKTATFIVGYSNGKRSKTMTFSGITAPTSGVRTVFASVFSLLSIQNGTATVQIGDGTPFDLQRGFSNRHYLG